MPPREALLEVRQEFEKVTSVNRGQNRWDFELILQPLELFLKTPSREAKVNKLIRLSFVTGHYESI